MCVTFTSEQKKEVKESIKQVLNQPHIPSAKEQVSGIHYSAMALGLLQFGKVHANQGNNFNLYKDEMRGPKEDKFGELSRNEETKMSMMRKNGFERMRKRIILLNIKMVMTTDSSSQGSHHMVNGSGSGPRNE